LINNRLQLVASKILSVVRSKVGTMADSAATSLTVGWIGTGRMGKPLAERLARAGVPLAVWNRTRGKAEAITRAGAELVDDPSELAGRDVVFTMVTGSAELESVVARLRHGLDVHAL
jgi:3-hydroxyisobutyrate dehydrogenase-like beta-hydroxyacid dehydrogenase